MYFNKKQTTIRSTFVLIVIFFTGFYVFDSISLDTQTENPITTINIFYYNSAKDTAINGEAQCDLEAIAPVTRIAALTATTTELYVQQVLSEFLYTPLNPIEQQFGFTKKNIPTDIKVNSIEIHEQTAKISLSIGEDNALNECEDRLLRKQIANTINAILDISSSTIEITYI